jgi:PAS domain S-box-containing protein
MDTDRNLLFGVLALQADLIDRAQFVEACTLWAASKETPLANLLVGRGWIQPDDRVHLDYLLARKLQRYGGDARASLATAGDDIKRSLAAVDDPDIQRSLADAARADRDLVATVDHFCTSQERYTLMRLHASGGIGQVWLARDDALGREVALKELRPERADHPGLQARFLREARITGQLEHPGIVPVYELARRPGDEQPYYTMRFVHGRTLSEAVRAYHRARRAGEADPLGLSTLLNAFVTVCNTVAYAHSRGVVHRDLKGRNIVVGDFGEVVVVDWGMAKQVGRPEGEPGEPVVPDEAWVAVESGLTVPGQALGTPAYMAPEQASGHLDRLDARTDVYGLGAVLYEILTGQPPFTGADTEEVLRKVRAEEPVPPRQLNPQAPPALEALCLQALAKEPSARPAAAANLAREIQGWQESERHQAEEALRKSEEKYRTLVETTATGFLIVDSEGKVLDANEEYVRLTGHEALREILGRSVTEWTAEHDRQRNAEEVRKCVVRGFVRGLEIAYVDKQGKVTPIEINATVLQADEGLRILSLCRDITERKRAEESVRQSHALLSAIMEETPDAVFVKDKQGRYLIINSAGAGFLGKPVEGVVGKDDSELFSLDTAHHIMALDRRIMLSGKTQTVEELDYVTAAGVTRTYLSTKGPYRDAHGHVIGLIGVCRDITERKRAEKALRDSEERYRSVIAAMQDGIVLLDADGSIRECNAAAERILGLSAEQMRGRTPHDPRWRAIHEDGSPFPGPEHPPMVTLRTGQPCTDVVMGVHKPDGTLTWISINSQPLRREREAKPYAVVATFSDITADKQRQADLQRAGAELAEAR